MFRELFLHAGVQLGGDVPGIAYDIVLHLGNVGSDHDETFQKTRHRLVAILHGGAYLCAVGGGVGLAQGGGAQLQRRRKGSTSEGK